MGNMVRNLSCTIPSFEKLAEQYTSPSVAFVALSIDDNRWAWQNEASEKSLRVLQLRIMIKTCLADLMALIIYPVIFY